jgi:hypothetical protein
MFRRHVAQQLLKLVHAQGELQSKKFSHSLWYGDWYHITRSVSSPCRSAAPPGHPCARRTAQRGTQGGSTHTFIGILVYNNRNNNQYFIARSLSSSSSSSMREENCTARKKRIKSMQQSQKYPHT